MTIVHSPYKYVLNNLKPVYRCDKNLTSDHSVPIAMLNHTINENRHIVHCLR